jgi:hypothetical protein
LAIAALAGVTAIDTSVAGVTVSVAVSLVTPPEDAVMFAEPTVKAAANPLPLIVATLVADEFHVAEPLRFAVVESV